MPRRFCVGKREVSWENLARTGGSRCSEWTPLQMGPVQERTRGGLFVCRWHGTFGNEFIKDRGEVAFRILISTVPPPVYQIDGTGIT